MASPIVVPVSIVIDDREVASGLPARLIEVWTPTYVSRLDVGDVRIGADVLVERKTVEDFVRSLSDGRLFEQATMLDRTTSRPLLIVEGPDAIPAAGFAPIALRGALLALMLRFRIPILRTMSIDETAAFLCHAARKESRRISHSATRATVPRPAQLAFDVLNAIPSIGDERARRLLARFGSARAVVDASERQLRSVEGIGPVIAKRIRRLDDESP